jgi:hypothetical protein
MEHLGEKVRGVYERHHKWAASFEPLSPTEPLNACLKRVANHLQKLKNFPDGNSFFFPLHVSRIARRRPRRPTAFSMPGFFGQAAEYQNYKA